MRYKYKAKDLVLLKGKIPVVIEKRSHVDSGQCVYIVRDSNYRWTELEKDILGKLILEVRKNEI